MNRNAIFPPGPTLGDDDHHDTIPCSAPDVHDAPTLPSIPANDATPAEWRDCPDCNGTGQKSDGNHGWYAESEGWHVCDTCSGAGELEVDPDDLATLLAASILKVRADRGQR